MIRKYSLELLEYTRLTLRLVELHPHREQDVFLAAELKFILRRRIAELESEIANRSLRSSPFARRLRRLLDNEQLHTATQN